MDGQQDLQVEHDEETGDVIVSDRRPSIPEPERGSHGENLALRMDESDLNAIGSNTVQRVTRDKGSRSEWEAMNERAVQLLGLGPRSTVSDSDYENADKSDHPLLLEALVQFQATALGEMLPPEKVCTAVSAYDTSVLDHEQQKDADAAIKAAGRRVEAYYLDYLTKKLPSYVEDTDLLLRDCGLFGVGIRKVYIDRTIPSAAVRVDYVPLEDLFIAYDTRSTRQGRITHRMRTDATDMVRYFQRGIYRPITLQPSDETDPVTDQRDIIQGIRKNSLESSDTYTLYEMHAHLFLPDDPHPEGLARPYIVTTESTTGQVLAVWRNWIEGDPEEKRIEQFVAYPYHPGKSSIFALGLGALLANQTEALRSGQRAGLDAGYLANHPAGFKKSNFTIREDNKKVMPGEFVDVDAPGAGPIQDSIMLHPFEGPNAGLMALMDRMTENARRLGGTAVADLSGMMGPSVAPGPALAAFDEQTKFQTAVHGRLYRAHSAELDLIHERTKEIYANQSVPYGKNNTLEPTDLILTRLLPAMDPAQISRARRMMESQAVLDVAKEFPDVVDKRQAVIDFLNAIGTDSHEHLIIPEPQEAQPADAITEYGNALKNMPLRAGPAQNHMAHIEAHVSSMRILATSGLNQEDGARVMAAVSAHIAEHMALDLAVQVAAALSIPLAQFAEGIPPEIEAQIAPMIATAVQQVEQLRAAPSDEETKIQIERIRAENRLQVEQIRSNVKLAAEGMASARTKQDNEADVLMNREDNATSLLLAGITNRGKRLERNATGGGTGIKGSSNPAPRTPTSQPNPMRTQGHD